MSSPHIAKGFISVSLISILIANPIASLSQVQSHFDCNIRIVAVAELSEPLQAAEVDLLYALQLVPVNSGSMLATDIFYGEGDLRNKQFIETIEPFSTQSIHSVQLYSYGIYARVSFHHIIADDVRCSVSDYRIYQFRDANGITSGR